MDKQNGLYQEINIDELRDPEFVISLDGIRHVAQLNNSVDLENLSNIEERFKKEKKALESDEGLVEYLCILFPNLPKEKWTKISISKKAAVIDGAIKFLYQSLNTTIEDLQKTNEETVTIQ